MFRECIVAAALAAAASISALSGAQAATIAGGSDLLDSSGAAQIETWLGGSPTTFTNIYDKTSGDISSAFHSAVDGKGATVFVAEVSGAFGTKIIGGYNPQSWSSSGDSHVTTDLADRTAFIFNLTDSLLLPQATGSDGQYQTYNASIIGPSFGGGFDLQVDYDMNSGRFQSDSYCPAGSPTCFGQPTLFSLAAVGSGTFTVGALETFSISASVATTPIPAALPLFASALGGLGLFGWRRRRAA
jgi:hypothetical protein